MFRLFLVCLCALTLATAQESPKPEPSEVPVIDGDIGACSADFTVTNTNSKPLYKAKITVKIKHGFGGFRRMNLEIYTNIDGKARVKGLPSKGKAPLSFDVSYEGRATTVVVDTEEKCDGTYTAMVTDKVVEPEK